MSRLVPRVLPALLLLAVWLAFWGRVNLGLLLVGGALSALLASGEARTRRWTVRPLRLLRAVGGVAWEVVRANAEVVREVVTVHDDGPEAIVEVRLRRVGATLDRLVALLVTLTPGTIAIGMRRDQHGSVLVVHVLKLPDEGASAVRDDVHRLEDLVADALLREHSEVVPVPPNGGRA